MTVEPDAGYLPLVLLDGLEVELIDRGFYESAALDVLVVQACDDCAGAQHPPRVRCGSCGSAELSWRPVSGRGVVFSFTVVHHATGALHDHLPYNIVLVELEDAPAVRLVSNVIDAPPEHLEVGLPVEVLFEHPTNSLPVIRFRRRQAS